MRGPTHQQLVRCRLSDWSEGIVVLSMAAGEGRNDQPAVPAEIGAGVPPESAALAAYDIRKRFGGVQALEGADLKVERAEIHAVLGENGAGKSTLIKIVAGVVRPDGGKIFLGGRPFEATSPQESRNAGIAVVYQELSLFPELTVAQNLLFKHLPRQGGLISIRKASAVAEATFTDLGIEGIDPRSTVSQLSLDQRQLLEIAKATVARPKILILDEATSSLGTTEVERLFELVRTLRAQGTTVLVVTHRMSEIWTLADSMTILRDGKTVGRFTTGEVNQQEAVRLMAGRDIRTIFPPKAGRSQRTTALEVRDVLLRPKSAAWHMELHHGEVLGLGGLEGQGQREFLLWLYGRGGVARGTVLRDGEPIKLRRPADALAQGIVFIPEDRKVEGLHLDLPVRWNLAMATLGARSHGGVLNLPEERAFARRIVGELDIRVGSPMQLASTLSGGTQQKVVLGKFMASNPSVLLFVDPTRGIDVRTKFGFYEMLRELAARGAACVLYSSDTEELVGLCDRIAVFHDGSPVRILEGEEITQEAIVGASFAVSEPS